jgi:pimeloyl-ACP methyl ester carboxylesterase
MARRSLGFASLVITLAACSSSAGDRDVAPAAPPDPPPATEPALAWAACDTSSWPDGFAPPPAGVECTTVSVPLDHAHPEGATIDLRVARQRSRAFPTNRAVFQLAGGPGGGSVWQTGTIPRLMPRLLDRFDLVYVDQRGTGGSGYLDCAGGYPATKADWTSCGTEHATDPLSHYLTLDAAHDLDRVRAALGYDKIHVRAGSYGTRLGLEYLRSHGENVAAIVLDGVDPPDGTFFRDFIRAHDRGVTRMIADCKASAACVAASPDLEADLDAYRSSVAATPRPIVVDGAGDHEDEAVFLEVLGGALFEASTYSRVPRAIHAAVHGDLTAWDALMSDVTGAAITEPVKSARLAGTEPASRLGARARRVATHGPSYVAPGLYMSVLCAESLPNEGGLESLRALQAEQRWGGDASIGDIAESCAAWNVAPISAASRAPVSSDAKVLLLDGALDLNTFPEWGAHAAATLPHATNLVVPYATHSTMSVPCVGQIITDFLEVDGDMTRVDTSCIEALPEPAW